ncbi:DUF6544 family protein [Mariniflexile aquimaris]|uniref:DUF6544 family protein n=1 Tax=Mariniflexile aquimaris TaxID=881009 RepID=A0ABW3BYL0_9FLAO
MRTIFLVIVLLHGLIHLLGFIKAFNFQEIKELTLPVSKLEGTFWIIGAILFLIYGILYFINNKQAWLIAIIAVIVSQILIFYFWKDARFGTIPNLIILIVALVGLGSYLLHSEFTSRVKDDFEKNNQLSTELLTETDIAHLPIVVQKYLHYTKSVGQPKVKNFRAEFTGGMRSAPNDEFMTLQSLQYNFYQKPSRYFYMTASKMGLPATGLHLYQTETATFEVKLLHWFKVVDSKGDKMNQAETVTLLNDMCVLAPATLIDRRITWETINDSSVKVLFKIGSISISAMLYFNEKGELVNFISNDRYHTDGKKYISYPWATPVEDYKMINGYLLPSRAQLIYQKPDGEFIYGELVYKSVKYNLSRIED